MWDHVPGLTTYCNAVLQYTGNAEHHVAQASSSVLDPTGPPQDPTDLETIWDLLQEDP